MSGVIFEEEQYTSRQVFGAPVTPKSVKWLVDHGVVTEEKDAHKVLIIITALFFVVSFAIFFRGPIGELFTSEPEITIDQKLQRERFEARREARGIPINNN